MTERELIDEMVRPLFEATTLAGVFGALADVAHALDGQSYITAKPVADAVLEAIQLYDDTFRKHQATVHKAAALIAFALSGGLQFEVIPATDRTLSLIARGVIDV